MGLFKKIKKVAKTAVTKVVRPATKAVMTGGISLVAPKLIPKPLNTALNKLTVGMTPITLKQGVQTGLAVYTANPSIVAGGSMAFNLSGLLGGVGQALGGVQGANASPLRALGAISTIASASITPKTNNALKPTPLPGKGAGVPALANAVVNTGAAMIPAGVAQAGQWLLNRMGVKVVSGAAFIPALKRTLAAIASFARRTPTGSIVSVLIGMGMAVNLANELVAWYATKRKRRRMNAANGKALNRAARRIKAFHRMCQHTDLIKTRGRSRSFGRCGSCRKSPCSC